MMSKLRLKYLLFTCIPFFMTFSACESEPVETDSRIIDIQGHRGARGLAPENTTAGFIQALRHGATTIEMDLVISAEHQMVVSHEPWMHPSICMTPDGQRIEEEEKYNIYEMSYSQIMEFDCGRMGNSRFPRQEPASAHKPLFIDAVMAIQQYSEEMSLEHVHYNIELKTREEWDGHYHPSYEECAEIFINEIHSLPIENRFNVQSFDIRLLQYIHMRGEGLPLALLVDESENYLEKLEQLGFTPEILSPHYSLIDRDMIRFCQRNNMELIPWTVNDRETMQQLLDMGINSIITDYPNVLADLVRTTEGMEIRNLKSY